MQQGHSKLELGGDVDIDTKYVSPTIFSNVHVSDPLMKDEIFGPVLPVLIYDTYDDIKNIINSNTLEKPLTIYIFSKNRKFIDRIISDIPSGGVCVNDVIYHVVNHHLPFGGVGNS